MGVCSERRYVYDYYRSFSQQFDCIKTSGNDTQIHNKKRIIVCQKEEHYDKSYSRVLKKFKESKKRCLVSCEFS